MTELGTSPTDSTSSIEVNDALFCEHGLEVCTKCAFDAREDNDAMMGLDPAPRAPLEMPAYYRSNKDHSIMCKAHASSNCKSCFGWKKQIVKLHKEGKKSSKNKNNGGSNF
ncbi:hypothetical protein TREMEDRAFT_61683 [Tremella mesenterica DSM 1558]|uniref:uncharacterized protein n=1 Tax=Tremella mesenterica (strain ATCC 24925 / CBS 8224 / DSM 1558 / NBRC 9311 / NRRL Y-6157 / RJB 2259-6 / UBC 559-6) TaxID=578456 RepID=UPI0003F48F4B|nr:uncharacterized protein TREMEDRAFT_61683 [Tremella mesenterica DSM 1558]EIW69911.1 hypothetical protein TREMEDRAFT_61683 [Tremella mesenterica DSM 1558]